MFKIIVLCLLFFGLGLIIGIKANQGLIEEWEKRAKEAYNLGYEAHKIEEREKRRKRMRKRKEKKMQVLVDGLDEVFEDKEEEIATVIDCGEY